MSIHEQSSIIQFLSIKIGTGFGIGTYFSSYQNGAYVLFLQCCQFIFYPKSTRYMPGFEPTTQGASIWAALFDWLLEIMAFMAICRPSNGHQRIPHRHADVDLPCNPASSPVQTCLLYTSPSPRDRQKYRMPSSA